MRKIIIFICILMCVVSFTGCGDKSAGGSSSEAEKDQFGYSLAPTWKDITQEQKIELLREIKNSGEPKKGLSFYAYSTSWNDDGTLTVNGFVRNKTGSKITNITGEFTISTAKGDVAKQKFAIKEESFGTLSNRDNRPWKLVFDVDSIIEANAELEDLEYLVKMDTKYEVK